MSKINRSAVRKELLNRYNSNNYHKMERVGTDVYEYISRILKKIADLQPGVGKTIKAPEMSVLLV